MKVDVRLSLAFLLLPSLASADKVDDLVRRAMEKHHVLGVSLAVVRDGRIVKSAGYGWANVELKVKATPNTVFEIGSVTKQFTATLVMMMVEEGKVDLDAKIPTYLDGLPATWKDVTVRQLLTHTSGIKNFTDQPNFDEVTLVPASHEKVIGSVANAPLNFPSGSQWSYSNTNYFLLGMILEKVSGKSYSALLTERIFRPLGMNQSVLNDLHTVVPNRASGYEWRDGSYRNADAISMSWPYAAGAIATTVQDLAKWDASLYTAKLLKPSSLQQMWTPVALTDGKTYRYGFGWFIDEIKGHLRYSHGGGIPGFTTSVDLLPKDKLAVIVLCNSDDGIGDLDLAVAGLYVPDLAAPTYKPIPDKEPQVTAAVRKIIVDSAAGQIDQSLFTPELGKSISEDLKKGAADAMKKLGPVRKLTLLERTELSGERTYRYRIICKSASLMAVVKFDSTGKISLMSLNPE